MVVKRKRGALSSEIPNVRRKRTRPVIWEVSLASNRGAVNKPMAIFFDADVAKFFADQLALHHDLKTSYVKIQPRG
jgi:hypothetical protein